MGGGKKVTVGYKYYLGEHMVLCHGPIDNISQITVDERTAWAGVSTGGSIGISKPELFGGESREGGISGTVDLAMGGPAQGQNSYLVSQLGADVPAYRGVVSAILRQCYLGNNPYLKPWRFRGQRVYLSQGGAEQWYKGKAGIGTSWDGPQAICIALDVSGSMDEITSNGLSRLANAKIAVANLIDFIKNTLQQSSHSLDIIGIAWGGTSTTQQYLNASTGNLDSLKSWFNSRTSTGSTDFRLAADGAATFFAAASGSANRSLLFITDGLPDVGGSPDAQAITDDAVATLDGIAGLTTYAFNIDQADTTYTVQLDNSPGDGVPVVDGSDPNALLGSLAPTLGGVLDMNGAHIIRECLVDPDWGMGYQEADIDDVSFEAAADTVFSEGLGTSLLWDRQILIDDFVQEIVKHIDAALYVDRKTGKFKLKMIRDDYDPETLIVLDESNISKVTSPSKATFGELVNSVTVNYYDARNGKEASITVTDPAMVQMQGAVINTTMQYPGFSTPRNATIAGQRDLRVLSSPFLSCTIYTDSTTKDLNIGDTFKFRWSRWQITEMIMRVTGIAFGDGKTNQVRITCTQDVYSTPTVAVVTPGGGTDWVDPSAPPEALENELAQEAPYYELVQVLGQSDVDASLASKADIGYVMAAAARSNSALTGRMWTDDGTGYDDVSALDFCPYAELAADAGRFDTVLSITNGVDLDLEVGTVCQIGDELCRIDDVDTVANTITLGRGILDTIPLAHLAESKVFFWDVYAAYDPTEYVLSEEVDVKIQPTSGAGVVSLGSIVPITVTLNQRAFRPYRPSNVQVNGELEVDASSSVDFPATITWGHRNRTQETSGSPLAWTDASITAEVGTTYQITLFSIDSLGVETQFHQEDIGLVDTWELDVDAYTIPSDGTKMHLRIEALRDGVASWTSVDFELPLLRAPGSVAAEAGSMFAPTDLELSTVGGGV